MMYTKEIIKNKWNQYCDTDKLVDDIMTLLTKYGHRNSEHGVCTLLDQYFTNKEPLIKMLVQSPRYSGDLRIIFKEPFVRERVPQAVRDFVAKMRKEESVKKCILKYKDENGKVYSDYIYTGMKHMNLKQMKAAKDITKKPELAAFNLSTGATNDSVQKYFEFDGWLAEFLTQTAPALQEPIIRNGKTLAKGTKTSRAFNKICVEYGVDKWNKYNKEFAKYADMVSGTERQLNFIISVNPLDYLTMSFGKSWASCHTIDKNNRRHLSNAYAGQYCNGTLSYMIDASSIVTFVLESTEGNDGLHEIGKLYRCMFHVNSETHKCIQGRIYPQGNDGSTDLYKKFRAVIQHELSEWFELPENRWIVAPVSYSDTNSNGTHYQDYHYNADCKVFYPSSEGRNGVVNIGKYAPCVYCGEELHSNSYLSHVRCDVPSDNE